MSSKYPILKPQEIIYLLEKFGFTFKSQKGSHIKYIKDEKCVIIPNHREVARGTLKGILEQANIDIADFLAAK